jgi:hypothetical protein
VARRSGGYGIIAWICEASGGAWSWSRARQASEESKETPLNQGLDDCIAPCFDSLSFFNADRGRSG